jgi:hypothetical protein
VAEKISTIPVKTVQYGLWNPNHDCFLCVSNDLEILEILQMLMSTKALTQIVILPAWIFDLDIIDNSCCQQWTTADVQTGFNEVYKNHKDMLECEIVQKNSVDATGQELYRWVEFFYSYAEILKWQFKTNRFDIFVRRTTNFQSGSDKLFRLLLTENNLEEAKNLLNSYLKDYTIQSQ